MATTSNFGWTTPDDTALVKDGAAAIRSLGSSIDSSMADLKGGTSGQVLAKNSNTDMDFTWTAIDPLVILDAKGDLITATAADTPARLAVGSSGQVLTVDTTTSTGLKWASPSSGGWTLRKSNWEITAGTGNTYGLAYLNSKWWAWGTQGKLASSSDGITWATPTSGFGTTAIRAVTYGNGLYVAVGSSGVLSTSSDGTTWTTRTSGFGTTAIYDVTYGNGTYVAVGAAGKISYSTDGTTWTVSTNGGNDFTRVTYLSTGTVFSALGYTAFYSSTNGSTWTLRSAVWSSGAYQAAVVGTNIYLAAEEQSWYISTNGTTFNSGSVQGILSNVGYSDQNIRGIAAYDSNTLLSINASNSTLPWGLVKWQKSTTGTTYGTAYEMTHPIASGGNYNVASDGAGKIMCMDNYWAVVTNF